MSSLFLYNKKLKIFLYNYVKPSKSFAFFISKETTSSVNFPFSNDYCLSLSWRLISPSMKALSYAVVYIKIGYIFIAGLFLGQGNLGSIISIILLA